MVHCTSYSYLNPFVVDVTNISWPLSYLCIGVLIIGVNSNSDITDLGIENLKISTTPFSYLKAVKNLSYAKILNQIAYFDHNFMTVDAVGLRICRKTCQTNPENKAPKYRIRLTRDSTWRVRSFRRLYNGKSISTIQYVRNL